MHNWLKDNLNRARYHSTMTPWRISAVEQLSQFIPAMKRPESWKYTPLEHWLSEPFMLLQSTRPSVEPEILQAILGADPKLPRLVMIDGWFSDIHSNLSPQTGLSIQSLHQLISSQQPECQETLKKLWPNLQESSPGTPPYWSASALSAAFAEDGLVLTLSSNTSLEDPLEIVFLMSGKPLQSTYPTLLITTGHNSQMTVIERHLTLTDSTCLSAGTTHFLLGAGSTVEHTCSLEQGNNTRHLSEITVAQACDSTFTSSTIVTGGALVRQDMHLQLQQPGAHCTVNALLLLNGKQHSDFVTQVEHQQPNCTSSQLIKGIYDGQSTGVFNGTITVQPHAQQTNAFQSSRSILLSDQAHSYCQPQLKIWADDVRCSHGATTGKLDPNSLFYLRSRGLPLDVAQGLLLEAFAGEVLNHITHLDTRARLQALATKHLRNSAD